MFNMKTKAVTPKIKLSRESIKKLSKSELTEANGNGLTGSCTQMGAAGTCTCQCNTWVAFYPG